MGGGGGLLLSLYDPYVIAFMLKSDTMKLTGKYSRTYIRIQDN